MTRTPLWFKVLSVLALLWNLMGVLAFASDASMSADDITKLSADQQAMYAARPVWALIATGVATIGGTIGCLGLLLGKRWAMFALVASLLGVVVQDVAFSLLPGGVMSIGTASLILQAVVLLIAIALVMLARKAISKAWLT